MQSTPRTTSVYTASTLLLIAMSALTARAQSMVAQGCFSSSQPLTNQGDATYQSSANCETTCTNMNKPVLGLSNGNLCWCGDMLPAADSQVSDSKCNTPCQGYPQESCGGGQKYWTVWLTGLDSNVPSFGGGSSGGDTSSQAVSSSPSTPSSPPTSSPTTTAITDTRTTHARPTVVTSVAPGTTVVITHAPESTSSSSATPQPNSGGGTNVAGIAAGVVVGVLAAIAIVAGIFFFLRHRRKQTAEDEYKRSQVSDFMRGGERKPPQTGYSQMSDSRLDPEAGNRRDSQGSIRDDQDYSRRILRVANPDGS